MTVLDKIRRLKARKGFTLIEVLCAVIIFAILMVAVFSLFDPINKIAAMIKGDSYAEMVALSVEGYVSENLQTAAGIEIYWMTGADWADTSDSGFGKKILDFYSRHEGNIGNMVASPHALIIKRSDDGDGDAGNDMFYLYDASLKVVRIGGDVILSNTASSIGAYFANADSLEEHRLFDRAFYNGAILNISARIDSAARTNMLMVIDASRDNGTGAELRSKARRESITTLVNIGGSNPFTGDVFTAKTFAQGHDSDGSPEYRTIDSSLGGEKGWMGDYLILYNSVRTP